MLELAYNTRTSICISYGNHDLSFKKEDTEVAKEILKEKLEDSKNGLIVLNNEQVKINHMVITGFSPSREAYNTTAMPDEALAISKEQFENCHFSFNPQDLNILMSHENKFFTYTEIISYYKDLYEKLTLIIGGHLHDGYVPILLQQILKDKIKDYGIWEKIPPKTDMCRGLFKVSATGVSDVFSSLENKLEVVLKQEEVASVINRGIAKYSWFIYGRPSVSIIKINTEEFSENEPSRILRR